MPKIVDVASLRHFYDHLFNHRNKLKIFRSSAEIQILKNNFGDNNTPDGFVQQKRKETRLVLGVES